MEKLIESIYEIIKDYRSDEALSGVGITKSRIKQWIDQFDPADREFLLSELINIFEKRYISKKHVKIFLKSLIDRLANDFKFTTPIEFLDQVVFLDLQPEGKSQKQLLRLLAKVLNEKFSYNIENCGRKQQ